MAFDELLLGLTLPAQTINGRLDALAAIVQSAVPFGTVYAPDAPITGESVYPIFQVFPWREHLERTEAPNEWGNLMWNHAHAHGPDKWRIAILMAPLGPNLDEQGLKRELNDIVDVVRNAILASAGLPDASGTDQAIDAADYMVCEWDGQGELCSWHSRAYIGCYLTLDVQKLWQTAA